MNFELEFFIRDVFTDLRRLIDKDNIKNAEITERIKTLKQEAAPNKEINNKK